MRSSRAYMLAGPLVLFNVLVFVTALAYAFGLSFSSTQYFFENYITVLEDPLFHAVLWRTIWISAVAAVFSLVLGFIVAFHMWNSSPRMRAYLSLVVISPLLISVVVRTFGWIVLLGGSGPVSRILGMVGIDDFRLLFTPTGVIIALVHVHLPLTVLAILASLDNINPLLLRASQAMGASPPRVFTSVVLPLAIPGVVAGGIITFVLNLGSFVTPVLIGGLQQMTLGAYVYQELLLLFRYGTGYASAMITLVVIMTLVFGLSYFGFSSRTRTSAH